MLRKFGPSLRRRAAFQQEKSTVPPLNMEQCCHRKESHHSKNENNETKNVAYSSPQVEQGSSRQPEDKLLYDFNKEIKKLQDLIKDTDTLFDDICRQMKISGDKYNDCKETILTPVLDLLNEIIKDARQPYIYVMGRSRHGKTSLINAINNRREGKVDSVVPTTPCATVYDTNLGDHACLWKIVDSSGFFATTTPSMENVPDVQVETDISDFQRITRDLQTHKPDIILYVVFSKAAGNLSEDLKLLKKIMESVESMPPVVVVLSQADILNDPRAWPPELYKSTQEALCKAVRYTCVDILGAKRVEPLSSDLYYGCEVGGCEPFFYVIPTATLEATAEMPQMQWNINRLRKVIGRKLPCSAWLHYFKAFQDFKNGKAISTQIIYKLSNIAMTIRDISLPGQCTSLMLLQMLMIGIIAKIAGYSVSVDTVHSFLIVCDVLNAIPSSAIAACVALLKQRFQAIALAIGAGAGIGRNLLGVSNAGMTYCIGKSAQLFYFREKNMPPESYIVKWKPPNH